MHLVDFLNHGILPFVGRKEELERIARFWRGADEAHGARALLLVGEGGVGKSRLLEEAIGSVVAEGGAAVHLKLYPDAAAALAPLLARAIWESGAGRHLLRSEPEGTVTSVAAALRRMCRLRPTLVTIEDIHLLSGETLRDLATLLDILAEETVSILCAARPPDDRARGVLERFIVDEIPLHGIDVREIGNIWRALFNQEPDHAIVAMLVDATLGNALAIRSGMLGAITTGALAADNISGRWRATLPLPSFKGTLERHVRFLAEGMTAHLSAEEREAAAALAALGEIFSREAAAALLDDSERAIEALSFKGLIATSPAARPLLFGEDAGSPLLAFTHTLIHRQLAARAAVAPDRIIDLLARDLPLYSILPFQRLLEHGAHASQSDHVTLRAIDNAIAAAIALDTSADWRLGEEIWRAAEMLTGGIADRLDPLESRALRARSTYCRLGFMRRDLHHPDYLPEVNRLLELTSEPATVELAEYRLHALRRRLWHGAQQGRGAIGSPWIEPDLLVERFPSLLHAEAYLLYLRDVANIAAAIPDPQLGSEVEERLDHLLASPLLSEEMRARAMSLVGPQLLWFFRTEKELEGRLALLDRLEALGEPDPIPLAVWKVFLLESMGRIAEGCALGRRIAGRLRELGYEQTCMRTLLLATAARFAAGDDPDAIQREIEAICESASERWRAPIRAEADERLASYYLLLGMTDEAGTIAMRYIDRETLSLPIALSAMLSRGQLDDGAASILARTSTKPPEIEALIALATGAEEERSGAIATLSSSFLNPILRVDDLLLRQACIALLDRMGGDGGDPPRIELSSDLLRAAVVTMLEWLRARALPVLIAPALDRFGGHLSSRELAWWRRSVEEMLPVKEEAVMNGRRKRLTMLGRIELEEEDGRRVMLRGARLRAMLGLLVAAEMLERPLSHGEFRRLASGGEDDPGRARKGMNLAVHRLREALGRDVVMTDSEIPRLNLDLVEVDLLTAHLLLDDARAAAREGSLARAGGSILRALEITRGEVPFPGLYDRFFEAARDDFEGALHEAIVDLAGRLLREDDPADAERLLRRALAAMPGDGAIAELLERTLLLLGNRTEAERIRMQSAESA